MADTTKTNDGPKKKTVTKDQLSNMVAELVGTQIEDAIAPLKEQQTSYMDQLRERQTRENIRNATSTDRGIGIPAARFVRALAFAKGDQDKALHFAKKAWDDDVGEAVQKALQAGDFTAGGALLEPEFAPGIIELLRNTTVVRRAGARSLPMNNGTLTLRKQTGASTTSYVGESQNISSTEPQVGQIVMTAKKLAAIVPISNDLLTFDSGNMADEFVRDDLVMQMAVREDQAFLRDDGMQDTPKGLRYWADSDNILSTNGTGSSDVEADFKDLIQALEGQNVRMVRPAWLMAPRSKNHLLNLRDANGNIIYPEIRNPTPNLYGWPVFLTNNIPTNLGGGSDETEIYLVDMNDAIIAESSSIEITVDSSASYVENGSLVSAFARDETAIRVLSRHDFAVRHTESVAVITDVTWGS